MGRTAFGKYPDERKAQSVMHFKPELSEAICTDNLIQISIVFDDETRALIEIYCLSFWRRFPLDRWRWFGLITQRRDGTLPQICDVAKKNRIFGDPVTAKRPPSSPIANDCDLR